MRSLSIGCTRARAALLLPGLLLADKAWAHVKWFCGPIDGSIPPAPPVEVFTPTFFALAIGFAALVTSGTAADAIAVRVLRLPTAHPPSLDVAGEVLVRLAVAVYCIALWLHVAVVLWAGDATGAVLTPEMIGTDRLIGYVQIGIAALVLVPRTSTLAAAGLAGLYAHALTRYGAFYMLDYVFFLGIAAYLALSDPWVRRRWSALAGLRISILTASLAGSLMWTAVEKFLYPQWTIAVLVQQPEIAAGLPLPLVTTIAGFVEFSLAFYLLVGRGLLGRVAAVALIAVFSMAMPAFGMVDVIGHVTVISILVVTLFHGEGALQRRFRGAGAGALHSAGGVALRYVAMLAGLTGLYYGLHDLSVAV